MRDAPAALRLARALAGALCVAALVVAGTARAADDAAADDAAAKLVARKALATEKVPAEQWVGSYAGSCWTGALHVRVTSTRDVLRLYEIERVKSHDDELSEREVERWWVDPSGAIVKGERTGYEAGKGEPEYTLHYTLDEKTISVRIDDKPETESVPLPQKGAFMPDKVMALLALPAGSKGQAWRFATLGGENDFAHFTIEDLGEEKIATRTGPVTARKLKVTDPEGEAFFFVDEAHRILGGKWPDLPNLLAIAGTAQESRTDWWSRPADEWDRNAEALARSKAALEGQAGELVYAAYSSDGALRSKVSARLVKEEKDGDPFFHYVSTTAEVGSGATTSVEDWQFGADGKLISGAYSVRGASVDPVDYKLRVEGDKMISSLSDAPAGKEELTSPIPPHLVADSFFLVKAAAAQGPGSYRFNGFDLAGRFAYSILVTVKGEEEIATPLAKDKVKARRITITQNVADVDIWVDGDGKPLVASWGEGTIDIFGPLDKLPAKLTEPVGPTDR